MDGLGKERKEHTSFLIDHDTNEEKQTGMILGTGSICSLSLPKQDSWDFLRLIWKRKKKVKIKGEKKINPEKTLPDCT